MTHGSVTIHRFKCDEDGCRERIYVQVRTKTYARKVLRHETGWSEPEFGTHKCPEHNRKERVDDEDLNYRITRECPQRPIY